MTHEATPERDEAEAAVEAQTRLPESAEHTGRGDERVRPQARRRVGLCRGHRRTAFIAVGVAFAASVSTPAAPAVARAASAPVGTGPAVVMGIPTLVDPIRATGEPQIDVDAAGDPYVDTPGGSTGTDTGFYWHSFDGGQSFRQLGPPVGHALCAAGGGGDEWVSNDPVTNTEYFTELQAFFVHTNSGVSNDGGRTIRGRCASTPTHLGDDRPFSAVLHPTGAIKAPQFVETGGPMLYMAVNCFPDCSATTNTTNVPTDTIDYAWSSDGLTWHTADPGVPAQPLASAVVFRGTGPFPGNQGNLLVDQSTGYLYTPAFCSTTQCPDGHPANKIVLVVNRPGADRADPTNPGQIAAQQVVTVASTIDGQPLPDLPRTFVSAARDSAGTMYVVFVVGQYGNESGTPPDPGIADPRLFHVYYTASSAGPDYPANSWSAPRRVDADPASATAVMPWAVAGDAGRLAVAWYGTDTREVPDSTNPDRAWYPYLGVSTNATAATPAFSQQSVSPTPVHFGPMCQGGCPYLPLTPRTGDNVLDYLGVGVGSDGAIQVSWNEDANRLHSLDTSPSGLPLIRTARQVGGPRLIGDGDVHDTRFSTAPAADGVAAPSGDALYPALTGSDVPQLDLVHSQVTWDGSDIQVHVRAANLASLSSPDPAHPHVWWLTTWMLGTHLYFAKCESDGGGPPMFTAGVPTTYDRTSLARNDTTPMLADYRGGTPVSGTRVGNELVITVPAGVVGSPRTGDQLASVATWTVLDNGAPPFLVPGAGGNAPQVIDATPAYNVVLRQPGANGRDGAARRTVDPPSPAARLAPHATPASAGAPPTRDMPGSPVAAHPGGAPTAGAGPAPALTATTGALDLATRGAGLAIAIALAGGLLLGRRRRHLR